MPRHLKEKIKYNPDTGVFTRATSSRQYKEGDVCGCKNHAGYTVISIDGKKYRAARLAFYLMTGDWPSKQMDHINRVRDDDRWGNLREATASENCSNKNPYLVDKEGPKGLSKLPYGSWRLKGRQGKHLGVYNTFCEAMKASQEYWGALELEQGAARA